MNEDAPFIHPAGSILFLSSEGHEIWADMIFSIHFDETGSSLLLKILAAPINTVDDDIFFCFKYRWISWLFFIRKKGASAHKIIYSVYFPINNIPLNAYNSSCFMMIQESLINSCRYLANRYDSKTIYGLYKSMRIQEKYCRICSESHCIVLPYKQKVMILLFPNTHSTQKDEIVFKLKDHNLLLVWQIRYVTFGADTTKYFSCILIRLYTNRKIVFEVHSC